MPDEKFADPSLATAEPQKLVAHAAATFEIEIGAQHAGLPHNACHKVADSLVKVGIDRSSGPVGRQLDEDTRSARLALAGLREEEQRENGRREVEDAWRSVGGIHDRFRSDECMRFLPRHRERAEFGHREVEGFEIERDSAEPSLRAFFEEYSSQCTPFSSQTSTRRLFALYPA